MTRSLIVDVELGVRNISFYSFYKDITKEAIIKNNVVLHKQVILSNQFRIRTTQDNGEESFCDYGDSGSLVVNEQRYDISYYMVN